MPTRAEKGRGGKPRRTRTTRRWRRTPRWTSNVVDEDLSCKRTKRKKKTQLCAWDGPQNPRGSAGLSSLTPTNDAATTKGFDDELLTKLPTWKLQAALKATTRSPLDMEAVKESTEAILATDKTQTQGRVP